MDLEYPWERIHSFSTINQHFMQKSLREISLKFS